MSDKSEYLETICACEAPLANVIFVHGLSGNQLETWQCGSDPKALWPSWLHEEMPSLAIHSLGYPANKFAKNEQDLFERAMSALDYLTAKEFGSRPIIFVGHSLGGLLIKSILRKSCESSDEGHKGISEATRMVVYIAVPHTGTSLASIGKKILPNLVSTHVDILTNKTGVLDDLKQAYRDFADKKANNRTVAYYEKLTTHGLLVVDKASSDPGVGNCSPIGVDRNHIEICKPKDKNDPLFLGISRHLRTLITSLEAKQANSNGTFEATDFSEPSFKDRRSLLDKMIDAGREHEYETANDYQSGFARKYYSLGLSTSARTDHDRLLADVEQRFTTHIYIPLICKDAAGSVIQSEIQNKIIDPVCNKYADDPTLSNLTVLQALYFLTEQCRIRWDIK